jgi:FKBP-type peptidyl-prolyl cis-trans isomerase SlyD
MVIGSNKVVSFHYRVYEDGRQPLEESFGGEPLAYLHGHRQMIQGVEAALEGKQAGDKFSVTVPPEQAYGQRSEDAIQRISVSHVINPSKRTIKFRPGMVVPVNTKDGPREVVVVKAGLKTLDVDINHPLAGKTLTFDLEVVAVRDATDEEIAHGHAHGAGGHQH